MKNLTTTKEATQAGNQTCITFELSGRQFTIIRYEGKEQITVCSITFNKSLNKWNSHRHPHSGFKVFNNLQEMMTHYKKFDEEILGLFI